MICHKCGGSGEITDQSIDLHDEALSRANNLSAFIRINREIPGCPIYSIENTPEAQKALMEFDRIMFALGEETDGGC